MKPYRCANKEKAPTIVFEQPYYNNSISKEYKFAVSVLAGFISLGFLALRFMMETATRRGHGYHDSRTASQGVSWGIGEVSKPSKQKEFFKSPLAAQEH